MIQEMSDEELISLSSQLHQLDKDLGRMDEKAFLDFAPELSGKDGIFVNAHRAGLMLDTKRLTVQVDLELSGRGVNRSLGFAGDLVARRGAKAVSETLYKLYKRASTFFNGVDEAYAPSARNVYLVPDPLQMRTDIYVQY